MKKHNYLKFLCLATAMLTFASCKKDTSATSVNEVTQTSKADTAKLTPPVYTTLGNIGNCGIATMPAPPADAKIKQAGIILQVNPPGVPQSVDLNISSPQYIDFGQWNQYRLIMQDDGNLVLYVIDRGPNGTNPPNLFSIWASNTGSHDGVTKMASTLKLESDGYLTISSPNRLNPSERYVRWSSKYNLCANQHAPILLFQTDGNIVEEYKCAPIGDKSYGYLGSTGTAGGRNSNISGSFK